MKIITVNGEVTLRGVVDNENEKSAIEAAAKKLPGVLKVNNQLDVKRRAR
jgi:osmotically-inducible protein OsmY